MAAEGDHIRRFNYNYNGADEEVPDEATQVTIAASVSVIPEEAFDGHPNIVEVIFDVNVKWVDASAFVGCPVLRRVIMLGVEVVEEHAFNECEALTDVECGKLEIIGGCAFDSCESLRSVDLPSAKFIKGRAFYDCAALANVKFGKELETIGSSAFLGCTSLQRITLPLKEGIITDNNVFQGCENLKHVDLVEGAILSETIAALLSEEWKNDMRRKIDAINQILPTTPAGNVDGDVYSHEDMGRKGQEVRLWIRSVLHKIVHYKAQHHRYLDEAATTLQLALPSDIVIKSVLPFLELPSYTFEVEDHEEVEDDSGDEE